MKDHRLTVRVDDHLYKYLLKVQGYIWTDTNKMPSLAHVVRHLVGHGIHRRASGCTCKAPSKHSKNPGKTHYVGDDCPGGHIETQ